MSLLLLLFGLFSGCFLSVLVGIIGSRRNIGFGWAFIFSLLLTPLVGLLITLLSDPLPSHKTNRWGCLGVILSVVGALLLIPLCMFFMALFAMLFG
ncbi:MAG: hypothetical protein SNG02_07720 [Rikenellaceae bacterium]